MFYNKLIGTAGILMFTLSMTLNASSMSQEKTAKTVAKLTEVGTQNKIEAGMSAGELMKKAYATLGNLKKYSFEATIFNEDDLNSEMMIYLKHNYKVSVMRPNKVRIDVKGDVENRSIYFNDGLTSVIEDDKLHYAQVKVASSIDEALDELESKYGLNIPLTELLYSDMADDFNTSAKSYYLGTVTVDEKPCYYIALPGKEWDVQAWIEKGDIPFIRKVAFVDKKTKGQPRSFISLKWNLNSTIDESIFDFKAPEGAEEAKVLTLEEAEKYTINDDNKTKDNK